MSDRPKEVKLSKGRLFFNEHGILEGVPEPYSEMDVPMYLEMIDGIEELCRGEKHLFMLLGTEGSTMTREARELDVVERRAKVTKAQAVVVESLPVKLLANFYGRFKKLPYPYKVFDDRESAIEWLLKYQ